MPSLSNGSEAADHADGDTERVSEDEVSVESVLQDVTGVRLVLHMQEKIGANRR